MPVLQNNHHKMDKIHQAINQHLGEVNTLFQRLADTRISLGGLSAAAANEMRTYVISARAATTKLQGLTARFQTAKDHQDPEELTPIIKGGAARPSTESGACQPHD